MTVRGRRILVTGGRGFIGSHLVRRLAPENEVTVFDNGRRDALALFPLPEGASVRFIDGDVRDYEAVRAATDTAPDIVIHLAARAGVSSYYQSPVATLETNFLGAWNLLRALAPRPPELFVNLSTSEVYGEDAFRAREDGPTSQGSVEDPRWSYSTGKLAAEHLSFAYHRERGLPVVSLRPFNIYGPGQVGEGAVQALTLKALRGEDLTLTGDGTQIRAWCYIDDMTDALLAALEAPAAVGRAINVGDPRGTVTMLDLARRIRRAAGSLSKIVHVPHPGRDIPLRVPDISRARELLGYNPRVSLDEGLSRTVEWYAASGLAEKGDAAEAD